ncbi:MAG: hypothetical protein QOE82_2988, partial [Thermoanaerobaculia bacterium]|nr:hypothetical protein [Thermoanaerobaculia bacterium]
TSAAWCLGNAHPPGFPLFLLLTHIFTLLPIGTVAVRANIATAFFAAVSCAIVALAVIEILLMPRDVRVARTTIVEEKRSKKKQRIAERNARLTVKAPEEVVAPVVRPLSNLGIALIALTCGLLFAASRTLWQFANVTEVYAVNTVLMAGVAWGMLRWARTREARWLYLAALLFGLGLAVHHVTIGTGALGIAILITRVGGIRFWRSRATIIAALLLAAGLLVYIYLPIAASRKPVMNWGNPTSISAIVDHITGKQYRSYINTSDEKKTAQFDRYLGLVEREFGTRWLPLVPIIAIIGLFFLYQRQRTIFWYIVLSLAGNAAWFAVYPITTDGPAYAIPTFMALLFAFAWGAASLIEMLQTDRSRTLAAASLLVLPLISVIAIYPIRDRSRYWVNSDYAENALKSMRPNALLITGDWQLYSAMRYAMDVEHQRPDVEAIHTGFLMRTWYYGELTRTMPVLARDSKREFDEFAPVVTQYNEDPDHVDYTVLNGKIDALLLSLIVNHLHHGPVYITDELAASTLPRDANLRKQIGERWDIVPRGVLVELVPEPKLTANVTFTPPQLRGVADGTIEYEDDDVVPTEIVPAYRTILVITGRYLALQKKYDQALPAYRAALSLDPGNASIEREMHVVESQAGK